MDPSGIRAQPLAGPGGQRLGAPPSGPRMHGRFDEVVTPQVEPSAAMYSFPRQRPPLAHQISPMVSSSPEEGGARRHGEKRRTRGAAVSPEPGPTASQDLCSSRSSKEDLDGTSNTHGQWHPGESQRPEIDYAPIFTPSEEEFKDAIGYIASIRPQAEKYGICRIIPPSSWRPPCSLKEKSFWECTEFNTRVQQVDKLQNREPPKKKTQPRVQRKRKRRKRLRFGMTHRRSNASADSADSEEKFGFQSGSDFTLDEFKKYADEFKQQYFGMRSSDEISLSEIKTRKKLWEPSVEEIEGEYWRIVVCPSEEVEVDYGADLDTATFSSGFTKASSWDDKQDPYSGSCWNLNNLPRLPGSVISFEKENISGVVVPWLYVGMCFSSFCWHVEDHFLYSLNYMHFGEPKVWYGVPGSEAVKLEESMRKNLPKLFEEQPDLLHELVTQLSPSVLKSEGVPVYRAVQNPGEFILTLPRAYHSGFNCGLNCAEAVNIAPVDWLPHGQCAVELYREQCRKTSISHDKLLLKTAKEAVTQLWLNLFNFQSIEKYRWVDMCGKNGVLTSAIKTRVALEDVAREANALLKSKKMDQDYDSTDRECFSCFYDLHLSAVSCPCSPYRFACLNHANLLCSCEIDRKLAHFRYSLEELNTLVAALEGDQAALCRWGQDDLGLVFPSDFILKNNMDFHKSTEFAASLTNASVGSGFGDSQDLRHDLGKPSGTNPEEGVQKNCVDLSIGDPPSSSGIKEKHGEDKMTIDQEPPCHLFGVDIRKLVKASDIQVSEMAKPASGRSDVVSKPMFRDWVEPLDYGTVMIGKKWFNNKGIFPKGFRSRVTFYNVQDPTRGCCYISEVLDAGPLGPLFKVKVEQVPEISFTDISPMLCWDSVRDRVNEEIKKQQSIGKPGVPDLLSPDSVNGIEMFGFLSPQIIQEIEALDPHHQCLDYWLSKPSFSVEELPSKFAKSTSAEDPNNSHSMLLRVQTRKKEPAQRIVWNKSCADEVALDRLSKKAKLPERPGQIVLNKILGSGPDSSRRICRDASHSAG